MNNRELIYKLYKPYRITRKGKCIIMDTMEGSFSVKEDVKIDYRKLYEYLYSRSFNYLPLIKSDTRDDLLVTEYINDVSVDKNQKATDLIRIVALLHNKTAYFKEVVPDNYKKIYDDIKNNVLFIDNYYSNLFDLYILEEYHLPSHYLFLRNYSLIYNACQYLYTKLDEWYLMVKSKDKERVVLNHNHLKLEHFLKNDKEYLISWDNYLIDSPVLDLFKFYQNEWENISFVSLLDEYSKNFTLLKEERLLLDICISIPYKIDFLDNDAETCRILRRLITYLNKSSKIILN